MFEPETFHFTGYSFDEASATARLGYRFDDGPELVEMIRFEGAEGRLDGSRREALDRALRELHLAAGVSYYKAGIPRKVLYAGNGVPVAASRFFEHFYRKGLGEFAWRNGLHLGDRPCFQENEKTLWARSDIRLPRRSAVPIGGGKDSIVALEFMRRSGDELLLVSVGSSPLIDDVADRAGLPHFRIRRELAPELKTLNETGAWNGHVPITGIIGFILVCGAVLYGYDTVVMANERSASDGNLTTPDGTVINHQFSKSLEFERAFSEYISRNVLEDFRYFSLLRPLSELEIARHFSFHERYFDVFSSCNRNFGQSGARGSERWCRECPKCRFVFLMLAPFIPKPQLVEIFGANVLDDEAQIKGFDALLGRSDHKPFECVGEPDECEAAFSMLSAHPDWRDDRVVKYFTKRVLPGIKDTDALTQSVLEPSREHRVPEPYRHLPDAPD